MKVIDEWEPIKDFYGYYINRNGEVKSTNAFKGTKEIILKGSISSRGYKIVSLMNCGKVYSRTIHKLLAQTFIPNPNNLPCINHKDGNKLNNSLDNLEWCDYGYNESEAYRLKLKRPRIKEKQLYQKDKKGNIIAIWNSVNELERLFGYSTGNICEVCNGNRKTAYGYRWEYVK